MSFFPAFPKEIGPEFLANHIPHLTVPYIFATRGLPIPDILATGSLVPNI